MGPFGTADVCVGKEQAILGETAPDSSPLPVPAGETPALPATPFER